jgi:hypothetical protein
MRTKLFECKHQLLDGLLNLADISCKKRRRLLRAIREDL